MKMNDLSKVFADASALSSVVEHYLHTVGVVGSKPTARTILISGSTHLPALGADRSGLFYRLFGLRFEHHNCFRFAELQIVPGGE